MNTETTVLDEGLYGDSSEPISSNLASTGQRLGNYLIDVVMIYILMFIVLMVMYGMGSQIEENGIITNFLFLFLTPLYYLISEANGGKTIGKLITRTKVVNKQGEKPSFSQILGRSFSRLVPFEAFSAFSSSKMMWHDKWSGTYLVKTK